MEELYDEIPKDSFRRLTRVHVASENVHVIVALVFARLHFEVEGIQRLFGVHKKVSSEVEVRKVVAAIEDNKS